jgi:hypothetical protein
MGIVQNPEHIEKKGWSGQERSGRATAPAGAPDSAASSSVISVGSVVDSVLVLLCVLCGE